MADAEYHRKQAEILAGLALSTSDRREAAGLSLLAAEHLVKAEDSNSGRSSGIAEARDYSPTAGAMDRPDGQA
jgi:hypothetical protein